MNKRLENSPLPWRIRLPKGAYGWDIVSDSMTVCMMSNHPSHQKRAEADARRIIACVNACDGISTENLIDNVPLKQGLSGLNQRIRDAEKQRDDALQRVAQLEQVLDGLPQDAIAGGWTAKGISEYAKNLEEKLANQQANVNKNGGEK
ncbi:MULTISPECIES: hypothetical protein [Brenneria]|uniref:Uncharacterized protein n=2 Tax=Brenneria TaxID=71655 RepID=A0A421DSS8_9GAMM|nr:MULTISPECIES: hypothetical protein [Brenneria]RBP64885.1 hypothetical protein DES54_106110 [Brenneria salicis ATCC 15712 = DSM 30166]RLM27481.1 hypothetical protein BIY29_02245 [Brenneria alni]RLM31601.1 hypothetical protein BHG07_04915 [Brenneria salicis ATCC 15712 = DSM 30166]